MKLYTLELIDPEAEVKRVPLAQHKATTREGAEQWAQDTCKLLGLPDDAWGWSSVPTTQGVYIRCSGSAHWHEDYTRGKVNKATGDTSDD